MPFSKRIFSRTATLAFGLFAAAILGAIAPKAEAQVTTPAGRDFSLPRAEFSLTYSPTEVNSPPGHCGCFFMEGAALEGNFHIYHGYTIVADETFTHVGNIHHTGQPFSMLMTTVGTRLNFRIGGERFYYFKPFAQVLAGEAHGFNSAFPDKEGFIHPTADSFAVLAGIGIDYKYRRHLSFRILQADYGYTALPNTKGNDQNLLRISTGVTYHWGNRYPKNTQSASD